MEDISRDRGEEEEDRPPEEERKPERKRKIRTETLPDISYQEYSEQMQRDMDNIFNPEFLNQNRTKFNHTKKEVKGIRRYLLDKTQFHGIPAKFNTDASSSDVFKNTTLEKDRKKANSPIIYVKYKNRTAFSYNSRRDTTGERKRITDEKVYKELQDDLEREITEFKSDTFAGQVTSQFEQQQETMDLSFIDKTLERPEPKDFTPQAFRPSYRDIDDGQKEIVGRMKMRFEEEKYNLESSLRSEENRRRRAEENLERTIEVHKNHLKELGEQLQEKEDRIKVLENQLKTENFSQYDKDSTNREIQELKAEVTRLEDEKAELENTIKYLRKDLDDQQGSINSLREEIGKKQKRIEELEKSSQNRSQISQLRREKADLEKKLQAQIQRTKFVEESRDQWKGYDEESQLKLAASEEKILLLQNEKDDLDDTIKNLEKVNSTLVDKYRNYQVEVDKKLDKAKEEHAREKIELKSVYQKTISELESDISKLSEQKEKGFSDSEMNNLKSSLEKKNITIQGLEDQNHRLRDLNLSLRSIQEDREETIEKKKEEIEKKEKEIETQKQEFERVKKLLEERLRKKVQKLRDLEAENKSQEEKIESYLSQLEELNKKASQSVDKKVFQANQNEFTKVQEENKGLKRNVLQLEREKKIIKEREKETNDEITRLQERMKAKDRENTEFVEKEKEYIQEKKEFNRKEKVFQQNIRDKDEKIRQKNVSLERQKEELEDLREKKEKLEDALDKQRFYKQQYERKTNEYNALVESADRQINQGARDRDQLIEELKESQKQLQEYKEKLIDPKEHENMVRDNKDLIETMKLKDQDILYTTKVVNGLQEDLTKERKKYKKEKENHDKIKQNFENYRRQANQRERELEEWYRDDLKRINRNHADQEARLKRDLEDEKENKEFQLAQRLRPGDIKSVRLLLNNLSLDDLDEENYRDAYIKYKTARDNFAKKANDETSSKVQRLMFEELKKLADIRLDLLNMSFNRSAKTEAGKEFIRRTDQTLAGKFYRFRMKVSKYLAGTTIGAGVMGVFYLIYDLVKATASGSRSYATHYGYKTATAVGIVGKKIVKAIKNAGFWKQAGLGLTAATFVDKSRKDGFINTFYNWVYNFYYGIEYGLKSSVRIVELGFDAIETTVKTSADVAKYVANNTSTVFLLIISAIGIAITIKYSREK